MKLEFPKSIDYSNIFEKNKGFLNGITNGLVGFILENLKFFKHLLDVINEKDTNYGLLQQF